MSRKPIRTLLRKKLPQGVCGWVTRALKISGVTGQSGVRNIVRLGDANHPENIVLRALQRCNGPNPTTQKCITNVPQDDFADVTVQEDSLGWYFSGNSRSEPAPVLFSSSPPAGIFLANPFVIFRSRLSFSQLGGQNDETFTYCADWTVTTPPSRSTANLFACVCCGSGTGAVARHINGAWLCN